MKRPRCAAAALLLLLQLCSAAAFAVQLVHGFDGSRATLGTVVVAPAAVSTGEGAGAPAAARLTRASIVDFVETVLDVGTLYSVATADGAVAATVKTCVLAAASGAYDLVLLLDDAGQSLRALEIRPRLPRGFSRCDAGAAPALAQPLPAPGVSLAPVEYAAAVPVVLPGRGAPYLGQQEVTERDVLLASTDLPAAEREALARRAAQAAEKAPQSFFMQYWHIIVPGMLLYMYFSGGDGGAAAAPRARAAA